MVVVCKISFNFTNHADVEKQIGKDDCMNKYIKLIKNISIFAIGTFTSKLLVFLFTPFYTSMLSPEMFSDVNLVVDTSNLIIPVVTICITDAVIRFENLFNRK